MFDLFTVTGYPRERYQVGWFHCQPNNQETSQERLVIKVISYIVERTEVKFLKWCWESKRADSSWLITLNWSGITEFQFVTPSTIVIQKCWKCASTTVCLPMFRYIGQVAGEAEVFQRDRQPLLWVCAGWQILNFVVRIVCFVTKFLKWCWIKSKRSEFAMSDEYLLIRDSFVCMTLLIMQRWRQKKIATEMTNQKIASYLFVFSCNGRKWPTEQNEGRPGFIWPHYECTSWWSPVHRNYIKGEV